jgi:cyclopropane fatty-acyl-phospholipid synthase-like methyltransferase
MKSNAKDFDHIADYYDTLIRRYGHDPRACDYSRIESQLIKFAVLSDALDLAGKSVLDVGCGFADYYRYLISRFTNVSYVGIDITEAMIVEALKIDPQLDLRVRNVLDWEGDETFDVVTANGIFYLIRNNPFLKMQEIISAMFAKSNKATVFNSLSAWTPDKEAGEFYADPLETLAFCRTLTPWVTLRHDYHARDFTIYMYKDRNA